MAHAHAHHPPADLGPAFRWAVGLNAAYVLVEAGAGFLTGSLAQIADTAQKGVRDVHDLHIWALSTTRNALAVHLVWDGKDRDALLDYLADELHERFGISHTTVQLEARPCERASLCDYPTTVAGDA